MVGSQADDAARLPSMPGRRLRTTATLVASIIVAGCSLLPAQIECGQVDVETCHRRAHQILERKAAESPSRRIVSIRITDARGSYDITFDDGTGESMIVD